jgi:hypothetical protein
MEWAGPWTFVKLSVIATIPILYRRSSTRNLIARRHSQLHGARAIYRWSASLKPENCHRAFGGKKFRYVTRS